MLLIRMLEQGRLSSTHHHMVFADVFMFLLNGSDSDIAMDWSDHAIWWPSQNKWLDKTR